MRKSSAVLVTNKRPEPEIQDRVSRAAVWEPGRASCPME